MTDKVVPIKSKMMVAPYSDDIVGEVERVNQWTKKIKAMLEYNYPQQEAPLIAHLEASRVFFEDFCRRKGRVAR